MCIRDRTWASVLEEPKIERLTYSYTRKADGVAVQGHIPAVIWTENFDGTKTANKSEKDKYLYSVLQQYGTIDQAQAAPAQAAPVAQAPAPVAAPPVPQAPVAQPQAPIAPPAPQAPVAPPVPQVQAPMVPPVAPPEQAVQVQQPVVPPVPVAPPAPVATPTPVVPPATTYVEPPVQGTVDSTELPF